VIPVCNDKKRECVWCLKHETWLDISKKQYNERGQRVASCGCTTSNTHSVARCKHPDHHLPYWETLIQQGGRGSGKTHFGSYIAIRHLRKHGARARVGVMGPTIGKTREVCAEGPSGLITLYKEEFTVDGKLQYNRSTGEAWHRDGGYVKFEGSEEPDRWNGGNWSLLWIDEAALCNEDSIEQAELATRLDFSDADPNFIPQVIMTTTPKARKWLKELGEEEHTALRIIHIDENDSLALAAKRKYHRKYEGTSKATQELGGEFLMEVEGALWSHTDFSKPGFRVNTNAIEFAKTLREVVVSIDPATTKNRRSNLTGFCVAGLGYDLHLYYLYLKGFKMAPEEWAAHGITLFETFGASYIVGETNNGGLMVESMIVRARKDSGNILPVPFEMVHASQGKRIRAAPVAFLDKQGLGHHVGPAGEFVEAENQMAAFVNEEDNDGDDIVDAKVWAGYKLSALAPPPEDPMVCGVREALEDYQIF
jgi:phage terminase large subunit-like protein